MYGIDIKNFNIKRETLNTSSDAHDIEFYNNNSWNKYVKCDLLLDDGPHTLQSMEYVIKLCSQIMTDDRILIIVYNVGNGLRCWKF